MRDMVVLALCLAAGTGFGAVEKRLPTASSGEVKLVCEDAKGWTFDLVPDSAASGRDVVTVRMRSPEETVPPAFSVGFELPGTAVQHVWTCDASKDAYHLWPDVWDVRSRSQLASGTPIAVAFDGDEHALAEAACSEVFDKVEFSLLLSVDARVLKGTFRFFSEAVTPLREYEVKILIDSRRRFWSEAVSDATEWICGVNGFVSADVPEAAFDPLYSTWYAYWQDVNAKPLEREAEIAAGLGMRTMILDDGWQKVKSASWYSATGDWTPVPSRFPDMKAHVDAVHKAGLKYMLWLAVPYVGDESKAWARFEDKFLSVGGKRTPGRVGVLDPRFPEVREYLIGTYERVVGEWGFDGVKLDFIDEFVVKGTDPAVKDNYAGRDYKSVPAAVDRLMTDILTRLRKIRPNVLVEFRQSYMGPAILKYGNMIRAIDCPVDPWSNRKRICDLRLTSGRTAVHSDMIAWNRDETPEGAALPILNALFATVQYSKILADTSAAHREVMSHWIRFSQEHRDVLLKGAFKPRHPEANYPVVEAENENERIVVVYNSLVCAELGAEGKRRIIINATRKGEMAVDLHATCGCKVFDTFGHVVRQTTLSSGLQKVAVPPGGYLVAE